MKNITIVADKTLSAYARKLAHEISKKEGYKATFATPEKFRDNESHISGKNYILFIGKNEISEDYIPLIKVKYEKHGIIWGYDDTKAIIYIKNSDVNEEDLKEYFKKTIDRIKKDFSNDIKIGVGVGVVLGLFSLPYVGIYLLIKKIIKKNRIEKMQYDLGVISFLETGFDDFIK